MNRHGGTRAERAQVCRRSVNADECTSSLAFPARDEDSSSSPSYCDADDNNSRCARTDAGGDSRTRPGGTIAPKCLESRDRLTPGLRDAANKAGSYRWSVGVARVRVCNRVGIRGKLGSAKIVAEESLDTRCIEM